MESPTPETQETVGQAIAEKIADYVQKVCGQCSQTWATDEKKALAKEIDEVFMQLIDR